MPARIYAGVGDHPYFLTFYNCNSIDCKIITNFSIFLYISVLWEYNCECDSFVNLKCVSGDIFQA